MMDIDRLAFSRKELRYLIENSDRTLELWEFITRNFEILKYSTPWVLTIYFAGITSKNEEAQALRSASVSLKARTFFKNEIPTATVFIDPNTKGRFEVKYRSRQNPLSPRRRKYTSHNMTFNDLFMTLYGGDYQRIFDNNPCFPPNLLSDILAKCACSRFIPIGFVHYLRRHFIGSDPNTAQSFRGTLDTNISFWDMDWADYAYAASRVGTYPRSILEIKSTDGVIPDDFQKQIDQVTRDEILPSKHDMIFTHVPSRMGLFQELSYEKTEFGWNMLEKERKIDVGDDPRGWLRGLELGDGYVLHTPNEQVTKHIFFHSNHSVCRTEYLSIDRPPSLKAKKAVLGKYEERLEISRKDSPASRNKISEFLGEDIDSLSKCTPCQRNRTLRMLISNKTGRIFQITADHCIAEDSRAPLNQIEIEYAGSLEKPVDSGEFPTLEQEMSELVKVIMSNLAMKHITVLPSETTKFEWIKVNN